MKLQEAIKTYSSSHGPSPRQLKIQELADACHVTIATVYNRIRGAKPGPLYQEKIEEVLGHEIDW